MHFHSYQIVFFNICYIEILVQLISVLLAIETHGQENDMASIQKWSDISMPYWLYDITNAQGS